MKNYFDLKLKGLQIFVPIFILLLVYCGYFAFSFWNQTNTMMGQGLHWLAVIPVMFVVILTPYIVYFYIIKAAVSGLSYKDEAVQTDYSLGEYLAIVLGGLLLTFVTIGIYYPWFLSKVINFFAQGTSRRGQSLEFKGKGITLFAIIILALLLPVVIIVAILVLALVKLGFGGTGMETFTSTFVIMLLLMLVLVLPLYYAFFYKWFLNFGYGSKRIVTYAKTWHTALFLLGQFFLIVITLGFWTPAALLRIYRYFADRLVVGTDKVEGEFGFEFTETKDYLFILGQYFLTLITLGIYFPWAAAKVACRFANQTFVKELENPTEAMPAND